MSQKPITAAFLALLITGLSSPLHAGDKTFVNPQRVPIYNLPMGHGGTPISTEEPFISRDGRFLFFNTNKLENHKDLHFAERIKGRWYYRGEVDNRVNTEKEVEGNPTMDANYNLIYIDTATAPMARWSRFNPATGNLGVIRDVKGIPEREIKPFKYFKGNMGVEVSPDGETLYFSRATWKMFFFKLGPFEDSDIFFCKRRGDRYVYDEAEAKRIMQNINTPDMEYAAGISADGLEIFFTRLVIKEQKKGWFHSKIMRATRNSTKEPFGHPQVIDAIGGDFFVEGPALGPDENELYYHKQHGEKFMLYKVSRVR
jgi:hypothetical protein